MSDPGSALETYLAELRVTSRPHRAAVDLLQQPRSLTELVAATALSRRAVERLVRALDQDGALARDGGPAGADEPDRDDGGRRRESRYVLTDPALAARCAPPPVGAGPDLRGLAARLAPLIAAAPRADRHLDHVAATPESVARRARWMADELYLPGATVVFVGDHDLTSVALGMVAPDVRIVVVDVDDRLLTYVAGLLAGLGVSYGTHHLDLRDRLPTDLVGVADVFVTDPPYTPEGVALFVARGLAMLRPGLHTRGLLAYGYGEQLPTLGLKVQQALLRLEVALVEMVRDFSRYTGAYAVGAASDWYVLAPTPRTARRVAALGGPAADRRIYTHGRQALEASGGGRAPLVEAAGPPPSGPTGVDPDGEIRRVLDRRLAATVRTAAVDALLRAERAAGRRPSRDEVRGAVDSAGLGRADPAGRLGDLSAAQRDDLVAHLAALVRPGP